MNPLRAAILQPLAWRREPMLTTPPHALAPIGVVRPVAPVAEKLSAAEMVRRLAEELRR